MSVKLYVIPGHGDGDPGAGGEVGGVHYDEAERVRALATCIKEMGGDAVELAPFDRDAYKDSGLLNWAIPSGAQVVELHMDSASASAHGAHVIYKEGLEPDAYDTALAARVSEMFPGRANSLVGRGNLQNVNQAAARGVPYRLVENGFISNEGDLRKFNDQIDDLARIYLKVFGITDQQEEEVTDQDIERIAQRAAQLACEYMLPGGDSEPAHGPDGNAYRNMYNCLHWAYDNTNEILERLDGIEDMLQE